MKEEEEQQVLSEWQGNRSPEPALMSVSLSCLSLLTFLVQVLIFLWSVDWESWSWSPRLSVHSEPLHPSLLTNVEQFLSPNDICEEPAIALHSLYFL